MSSWIECRKLRHIEAEAETETVEYMTDNGFVVVARRMSVGD